MVVKIQAQSFDRESLEIISRQYASESFSELAEFFNLPNDAHFPDDIEKNIQWCENAFGKRGFEIKRLNTEKIPLLLATRKYPNSKKTVLVYLQIDGQPVDTTKWHQPSPYTPSLKEKTSSGTWLQIPWDRLDINFDDNWRIFARSSSDAKGPVMMFLKALDVINDFGYSPNYDIKIVMDFEEELGSPRLPRAVMEYKTALAADMLVIFDGPRHVSNQPTLTYGARGIATISLEVFGPRVPLHSGNYGNYVPNPALRLSKLLASMWDANGRVTIPNWYDGIHLSDDVRQILMIVPDDEDELKQKFGIATTDSIASTFQEAMQYPSLGILGLKSGWTGDETRTIIPSSSIVELDIRLVKETEGYRMVHLVREHIRNQGFHVIDSLPSETERLTLPNLVKFSSSVSYGAFRSEFHSELGRWLRSAMERAFGKKPIEIRTAGGSIPISPFVIILDIPAVTVPTVNPDNNQHSPNENLRLGNYVEGIKIMTGILSEEF